MEKQVKYWIETAQYDIGTAEAMHVTKRFLYVGFMCHQATEKGLKAVIASQGHFPPKVHNLTLLAQKSGIYEKMDADQKRLVRELNPLNIEARYPSDRDALNRILTESYCQELIAKTRGFFEWIKSQL